MHIQQFIKNIYGAKTMLQLSAIALAISDLIMVGSNVIAFYKEAKKNGWINSANGLRAKISDAKTQEERMALAKLLFEHDPR